MPTSAASAGLVRSAVGCFRDEPRPSGDRTVPYWQHIMAIDVYAAMADGVGSTIQDAFAAQALERIFAPSPASRTSSAARRSIWSMSRTASACTMFRRKTAGFTPRSMPALSAERLSLLRVRGVGDVFRAAIDYKKLAKGMQLEGEQFVTFAQRSAIRRAERSLRHQNPVIEIEDHRRVVFLAALEREIAARPVLGGDGAQTQRADVRRGRAIRRWPAPRTRRTRLARRTTVPRGVRH